MTKHYSTGFSLIELMIGVVIVGILASIATSYYGQSVISTKCTEGRSALLERSASLEKCKAIYGAYNNNCNIDTGATSGGNFSIGLVRDATTFTLTATGTGQMASAENTICKTITLNHLSVQGGSGTSPW